ncbi:MAG: hypothetical protein ABI167_07300 [Nitrosospira sp.]
MLISLGKRNSDKASNVLIRDREQKGIELRPQMEIIERRMFLRFPYPPAGIK